MVTQPPRTSGSIGVAVIGFGWMGKVHAQAYARLPHHFPGLGLRADLVAVADDVPGRAEEAAAQFGFATATTDWRDVAADPRIGAVSVTVPNYLHREIATALAAARKHLWIEKPAGLTCADARAIADAAERAGVQGTVGFNYRHAPAVAAARELLEADAIGRVTHARFRFLSDYAADPGSALTWRFSREQGGRGVLGDLASHAVDLARHLVGEISEVAADTAIFVPARAKPRAATRGHERSAGDHGPVENEDYVACLVRCTSGARGVIEACRTSAGEQNAYGFEIHGRSGALSWDFGRMGELRVSRGDDHQDQPACAIQVGPAHGCYAAFQPGAAIASQPLLPLDQRAARVRPGPGRRGQRSGRAGRHGQVGGRGRMGTSDMTVRVGVIGAGIMGADHVRTVQRSVIGAAVTMIADVDLQRAEDARQLAAGAATTCDAAEVIASEDVDAVIIASHDATHADLALAAIAAGKPVMCEKPLAPTVDECARIVRAEEGVLAAHGGRPLVSVGFMRRFDPGYQDMKAAIAAGACGVPLMVHCFHRGVRSVVGRRPPPASRTPLCMSSTSCCGCSAGRSPRSAGTRQRSARWAAACRIRSLCCCIPRTGCWRRWRRCSTRGTATTSAARSSGTAAASRSPTAVTSSSIPS
jgi:predicted dehydrogenase